MKRPVKLTRPKTPPPAARLAKALRTCERQVMELEGVNGVALTEVAGCPQIAVYVERRSRALRAGIPSHYDGVPVRIEVMGRLDAQALARLRRGRAAPGDPPAAAGGAPGEESG